MLLAPGSPGALVISCACHFIPAWGAPVAFHPVLTASPRANKMAHGCREDSVEISLSLQIPGGQAVTGIMSSPGWACCANRCMLTHTLTLTRPLAHSPTRSLTRKGKGEGDTTLGPPHPLLFPRHKPCPPCIAAHPYVDPLLFLLQHPRHVFTLVRRLWASHRPLASLLFDGTSVLVSPVEATLICRLSGLDRDTQAKGSFRCHLPPPTHPTPACLMSPACHRR